MPRKTKAGADLRTVDLFSGKTEIEAAEEANRIATGADAQSAHVKERDSSLVESISTEARSAVQWLSEVSPDARRAVVLARGADGSIVITLMRSTSPHRPPSTITSFKLSTSEAETLRGLLEKL